MPKPNDAVPKSGKKAPKNPATQRPGSITHDQVVAYLRKNPEFFMENPDLLDGLEPPSRSQGDAIVDFQHSMVQRLRLDVEKLTDLRNELLSAGRSNLTSQDRIHRAILALLEAATFEQFIERVTTDLAVILDLDLVVLGVEQSEDAFPAQPPLGISRLSNGVITDILGPKGQTLLRATPKGDPEIYGAGAGLVSSEALLRLNIDSKAPDALLALASRDENKFANNQGTELLSFLARVLENCFRGWLSLKTN